MDRFDKTIAYNLFAPRNSDDVIARLVDRRPKVVSFDVFDTLLLRDVESPHDIFEILELSFFRMFGVQRPIARERIVAERAAENNTNNGGGPTLEEIYDCFPSIPAAQKQWLIEEEQRIELSFCVANPIARRIYDWCRSEGIQIVLNSDMYLSSEMIGRMLKKCGYDGWSQFVVSAEVNARKSDGGSFDYILRLLSVPPSDLVHIGDSPKGDWAMPKIRGIRSVLLRPPRTRCPKRSFVGDELSKTERLQLSCLRSFTANRESRYQDFFSQFGFKAIGPILYGYSRWLSERIEQKNIGKVFFLAREGVLLEQAFRECAGCNQVANAGVLRVSRRATGGARIANCKSLDELLGFLDLPRRGATVGDLLHSCRYVGAAILQIELPLGIAVADRLDTLNVEQKHHLYCAIFPILKKWSEEQRDAFEEYLASVGFKGDVAVADVGWYGTIQENIQAIARGCHIYGYYIGRKEKSGQFSPNTDGYLFNSISCRTAEAIMSSGSVFELCLLSTEGSTVCYRKKIGSNEAFLLGEPEQIGESVDRINRLQEASLDFVREFSHLMKGVGIGFDSEVAVEPYAHAMMSPSIEAVRQFGSCAFLSGGAQALVASHSLPYYMLHFGEFVQDFLNSGAYALFLKSLLKVPLPYAHLVSLLRTMANH